MENKTEIVWKNVEDFAEVVEIFNSNALEKISKEIENALSRFGINVKMILEMKSDRHGIPYIKADSTSFNTFPVIFKEIKVGGRFNIKEIEGREGDNRVFKIECQLNYRWFHFDGGENGQSLGCTEILYRPSKDGIDFISGDKFSFNY